MSKSDSSLVLEVVVQAGLWPDTVTDDAFVARIAGEIDHFVEIGAANHANIAFAMDSQVQSLNAQFRHQDRPTNVLSFPMLAGGSADASLGDIILAYETVRREAIEQSIAFEHHVAHLIIHGILHLLGYDHQNETAANEMEALEVEILAQLGLANPYTEELVDADR